MNCLFCSSITCSVKRFNCELFSILVEWFSWRSLGRPEEVLWFVFVFFVRCQECSGLLVCTATGTEGGTALNPLCCHVACMCVYVSVCPCCCNELRHNGTYWVRGHVHGGRDFGPVELPFVLLGSQTEGWRGGRGGCWVCISPTAHQTHHLLGCGDGDDFRATCWIDGSFNWSLDFMLNDIKCSLWLCMNHFNSWFIVFV